MTSGPILVTSAAGRTGRAVLSALVSRGVPARGLVRRHEQALAIEGLGSEAVIGDLDVPASLVAAAEGCSAIVHIGPPMHPNEIAQTDAMLTAAKAAGIADFIYYSVMQPLRQDVEHHRNKLHAEAHVVESGLDYSILQPCRYMQHLDALWPDVLANGEHAMPFDTRVRFSIVDLADLAEATAIVATDRSHRYASYELAGPQALSQEDMAAILSDRLGRPIVARRVDPNAQAERMRRGGASPDRAERALLMNRHYDQYGFRGNANILSWLIDRPPTDFATYVDRLIARSKA
jgi:uncharacterized protein YbjT (DUF2867 family)